MGIRLENIKKTFEKEGEGRWNVLNGVSFVIEDGEMIAIQGKSGAGKSTLLQILGLLDNATTGSYCLDGENVEKMKNKKRAKIRNEKMGFVLQDFGLIEEESVWYNVAIPLFLGLEPLKNIRKKVHDSLKKIGIEDLENKKVAVLSGGEKQRVAIARAIINEPKYILADEPTGALDSDNVEKIMSILENLHKEGKTILVVTHDNQVAEKCDRTLYIKDGNIW